MAYNVFYTSIPVLVSTLDKDLNEGTVMQHPQILFYCQAGRCTFFNSDFLPMRTIQCFVLHIVYCVVVFIVVSMIVDSSIGTTIGI